MDVPDYIRTRADKIEEALYKDIPSEPKAVYGMLGDFIARGGKRIRPVLTLACASACGGEEDGALPYAVAIELFHNFTLIHDDLEDRSPMRRGKPTVHEEFGDAIAINSGDALYTVVWASLLSKDISPENLAQAERLMVSAFSRVVEGQGIELNWYREGRFDVSEGDYFKMAGGKTAALIGAACELGAFSAGATEDERTAVREFGEAIGLAFQIKDDVLNLTADPSKYKKKIGEDIMEGKRSLITIHLLANAPAETKRRAIEILAKENKTEAEVQEIISMAKEAGSVDYASKTAEEYVASSKEALSRIKDEKGRELLSGLADYIVSREK